MNDKCIEIGTIQAFLDGEASPELSFEITDHAAKCDNCALLIADAEEETAQVFALLDRELNSLVPTQRLWSSITVALAEEKRQVSAWDKARGYLLAIFANPSLAVAASVLVVFGLFAAVWTVKSPVPAETDNIAAVKPETTLPAGAQPAEVAAATSDPVTAASKTDLNVVETNFSTKKVGELVRNASYRTESRTAAPRAEHAVMQPTAAYEYLPGEESYVRTISNLKDNVESRKDVIMDPSTRISFERDLAVVDDAIKKMKNVVRKNPKNQAAKQVLYSSYQNKIDLLNSVVERDELMASMQ
jgi:hypothetical protein